MGFLDGAKEKLRNATKGIGEETIRVMRKEEDEKKPVEKPKTPKVKKEKPIKEKSPVIHQEPIDDFPIDDEDFFINDDLENEEVENESVFAVDDDDDSYVKKQENLYQNNLKKYENVPVPEVEDNKIQDILDLLNIPSTFEIERDVFLPEDLQEIDFDIQVPQGYDIGEVDTFVSRVRMSVEHLVNFLTLRNVHVAKLATVVDRLQIDANNLRYQVEVANGINIMPSDDTEELENENMKLKLLVKRLEEEKNFPSSTPQELSEGEREKLNVLQDELSIKERENQELLEEIYELKNQIALLQEDKDYRDEKEFEENSNLFQFGVNENDDEEEIPLFINDDESSDDEEGIPFEEDEIIINPHESTMNNVTENSTFYMDDESIEDFLENNKEMYESHDDEISNIEILGDNGITADGSTIGTYYNPEDEDDELDFLQDWGKNK